MELIEDILAHQWEAERRLAYCIHCNPGYARETISWLKPAILFDNKIRDFWSIIQDAYQPDINLATKTAIDLKILDEILKYQSDCSYLEVEAYAKTVLDDSQYVKSAIKTQDIVDAIIKRDKQRIVTLSQELTLIPTQSESKTLNSIDVGLELMASLDDETEILNTGINDLDNALGGMEKQTLCIIAGRPSMGKSGLAIQMAANLAEHDRRVLYFTPEMARKKLYSRLITHETGISWKQMRTMSPEQREQVIDANNKLIDRFGDRLIIDDRPAITSRDIWQSCNEIKPDVLVVDHLGLLGDTGYANEIKKIGGIAWSGKQIAKQFNLCAIYLSQLSRGVTARENKRPTLEDLRDSGELEQNGDVILALHRQDYYNPSAGYVPLSPTELWVIKNRDGIRNARVDLVYNLPRQWYYATSKKLGE